jgi:NodT family efflux transporter outer membrane factor (OMF) lipoprotein
MLDGLMEQTYQQNLSVKSAGLRVLQARYLRSIAVGGLFPQQQEVNGSFTQSGFSENTVNSPPDKWYSTGALGFAAAWELDFWGKFRRNIESADASLDATVEDYDEVLISLLSETASTYIELRTAQQQLHYAQDNAKIQQQSLEYAQVRYQSGAVTELDVTQAQTVLSNTQQSIPFYESQVRSANNSLCVLLGIPTRDLTPELGPDPIPTPPADLAVGVPANLLRRRPDVRAAERQVAAQSAAIGAATADLLPHFSIVGSIALQSENFSDRFKSSSTGGAISPGFNWDVLNYGRLINNVNLQDASFQQLAVAQYRTGAMGFAVAR